MRLIGGTCTSQTANHENALRVLHFSRAAATQATLVFRMLETLENIDGSQPSMSAPREAPGNEPSMLPPQSKFAPLTAAEQSSKRLDFRRVCAVDSRHGLCFERGYTVLIVATATQRHV